MAGILRTDTIQNSNTSTIITQTNSTTITIGTTGQTVALAAGASSSGFGATYNGAVNWDTTPKTTTVTAVSGNGYFINTTSGGVTVNLPAGSAGSIVAISDYANTAATNNITIAPNGTDKINGVNQNAKITTNGASITLLYVDSTRGWKDVNDATLDLTGVPPFVAATGGTVLTCGDYKTHVFTGPGTFTVTSAGSPLGSNTVEYLVVAGGGGGGVGSYGGGGGAGGYRQNYPSPATAGLPVTVTSYSITVGAGAAGSSGPLGTPNTTQGSPSIFSTITSTGGGSGGNRCTGYAQPGGSGGGISDNTAPQSTGTGNTPPVTPPQGSNGGSYYGGGGGGVSAAGASGPAPGAPPYGGVGGAGSPIATAFFGPTSPSYGTPGPAAGRYFAGGGAGGTDSPTAKSGGAGGGGAGATLPGTAATAGTTNTGGGGGGGGSSGNAGAAGGSGIVVIRYKFQ